VIVIGIGTRRGVGMQTIIDAIEMTLNLLQQPVTPDRIASAWFKHEERGLIEAAEHLRLPVCFVEATPLEAAAHRAPSHSARVTALVGVGSVAEAAALAEAGDNSRLLIARQTLGDVTCAIAEGPSK